MKELVKEHVELYGKVKWALISQGGKGFNGKTSRKIMDKWHSMLRKRTLY